MNSEWAAYAIDFVSFVIHKLGPKERDALRSIVLFGSVSRGDTDERSDVDLFFDTREARRLEERLRKLLVEYLSSIKVTRYWELLGVRPQIAMIVDDLTAWEAAHAALLKDGRVLFGRFHGVQPSLGQALAIVSWKESAGLKERTNLHRRLEGYRSRGKRYPGLLEQVNGEKLSKGTILVPLSDLERIKALFREVEVTVRMRVVYELSVDDARPGSKSNASDMDSL